MAPILRRTNEAPVPSLLDCGEEEYLDALEAERCGRNRLVGVDPLQPPYEEKEVRQELAGMDRDIGRSLHARKTEARRQQQPKAPLKGPLPRSCELPCDTFGYESSSSEDGDDEGGGDTKVEEEEEKAAVAAAAAAASVEVSWVPLSQRQAPRAASSTTRASGLLERTSGLDGVAAHRAAAPAAFLQRTCEQSPDTVVSEREVVGVEGGVEDQEDEEDEEEYMDSEEEHELMGCRLPPGEELNETQCENRANEC